MTAPASYRWAVLYKTRGAPIVAWAVLEGVPADVKRDDVLGALEAWSRWPAWQARQAAGSQLTVQRETQWSAALREQLDTSAHTVMGWATLAPELRRLTVPLDGALYARVSRAARGQGVSLITYATAALEQYVGMDSMDAAPLEVAK